MADTDRFYAVHPDRGIVSVTGADAVTFLQTIVTCDVENLEYGRAKFGALLTPQGKITSDFLLIAIDEGFLLDVPAVGIGDLVKRLTLYKLRAVVEISDVSDAYQVATMWPAPVSHRPTGIVVEDPRHRDLGLRCYRQPGVEDWGPLEARTPLDWHAHRISLGVPEANHDYAYGDVFPHDVDMDQLAGIDFKKGCYVGQEVVSRMEHRGSARRRIVQVSAANSLPQTGTPLMAGKRNVGQLKSVDGAIGLASVRIDRVADARANEVPIVAEGEPVDIAIPDWARFTWPQP